MTKIANRVTEKVLNDNFPELTKGSFLVRVEWSGGHNMRRFQLRNVFDDETEALTELDRLKTNTNNFKNYSEPRMHIG